MKKKVSYGKLIFQRLLGLVLVTALSAGCGAAMESQSGSPSENQSAGQSADKAEAKSPDAKSPEAKSPDANSTDEKSKDASSTGAKDKLKLCVTTSFLEDMAEVLGGDSVEISCIIPRGEDPHTYEAKPEDLKKMQSAQVLFYHGLHFEGKMQDALKAQGGVMVSKDFPEDKVIQAFQGEDVPDPHFWFDQDLYAQAVSTMAATLEEKLPEEKKAIEERKEAYQKELEELKAYTKKRLEEIPEKSRVLLTPHDAFQYFSRAYGIEVKAPQGVSTDGEVSAYDMAETAQFIVDHKIKAIFTESTTDPQRMKKLQESCKEKGFSVEVVEGEKEGEGGLFSDSLGLRGEAGDTYLTMVRYNVDLIVDHLK